MFIFSFFIIFSTFAMDHEAHENSQKKERRYLNNGRQKSATELKDMRKGRVAEFEAIKNKIPAVSIQQVYSNLRTCLWTHPEKYYKDAQLLAEDIIKQITPSDDLLSDQIENILEDIDDLQKNEAELSYHRTYIRLLLGRALLIPCFKKNKKGADDFILEYKPQFEIRYKAMQPSLIKANSYKSHYIRHGRTKSVTNINEQYLGHTGINRSKSSLNIFCTASSNAFFCQKSRELATEIEQRKTHATQQLKEHGLSWSPEFIQEYQNAVKAKIASRYISVALPESPTLTRKHITKAEQNKVSENKDTLIEDEDKPTEYIVIPIEHTKYIDITTKFFENGLEELKNITK